MFPYAQKLKEKFQLEEEGTRNIFLWDFRSHYCSRLHKKFPSVITNILLQLVRDIINGVCYQLYEKRLEQQKKSSKCLCLRCGRKLQTGTIIKSVFDYRFKSNEHTHISLFVTEIFCFFSDLSPGFRSRGTKKNKGGNIF